ncbi:ATP-dependent acyl-CoA ligase [Ramlibacter henchirensis]|uniref:ATP-dependent acyl-CoA ligase n=2 Tax=Ramlibacter henchirensis TaxID=204072 RepID=A0A4Z0BV27_9BURK|nr:ATP-dependent acyl-CoA ligase [Ramlibacter henchirensis]
MQPDSWPAIDVEAEIGGIREWTTGAVLAKRAALCPDRLFLRFVPDGRSYTFLDLHRSTNGIAHQLMALGIGKGAHVAMLSPNCPECLLGNLALGKIGAVSVPVNTAAKASLMEYYLSHADCTEAIVHEACMEEFASVAPRLPQLRQVVVIGDVERARRLLQGLRVLVEAFDASSVSDDPVDNGVQFTDLAYLLFTSGTTGPSKAIMYTHAAAWYWGKQGVHYRYHLPGDVDYVCMPLFHANALLMACGMAIVAGTTVVLDVRFSASQFWGLIRSHGVTRFNAIGAMANFLWSQPPSPLDRDHKVRVCSVAPAPPYVHEFASRYGVGVLAAYGLSDYGVGTSLPSTAPPEKAFSCGQVCDGVSMRIVDDHDFPLPTGEIGEILMRLELPWAAPTGYYKMPEATQAAWQNLWFHTGDYGYLDADGYLYLTGRKKDAIRRRGENISAFEVESAIASHTAVREVAVYPLPSEHGEDEVAVSVVLREGATLTHAELIAHCEASMSRHMIPRFLEFVEELPFTPTNKIEKYKLRERALDDPARMWDRAGGGHTATDELPSAASGSTDPACAR